MPAPIAIVAGAGIGGLAAAVALHRRGWDVTVYERAAGLEPVGAGITLAPNALRALDTLGLGDRARSLAVVQGSGGIRRPDGRWLMRTDLGAIAERFGDPLVVAHRAELIAALAAELPAGAVRTGMTVRGVDPGDAERPARVSIAPTDGAPTDNLADSLADSLTVDRSAGLTADHTADLAADHTADLVIAADGVRSAIRTALFPAHPGPRYAGFTTWRAVLPEPRTRYSPGETWGRGTVFGVLPLSKGHDSAGRVYCYASANATEGVVYADERAALLDTFGHWHSPIPELLASAAPGAVLHNDVYWIADPPPAYHVGRVALLGDAAHAMTPNLGQGGCQALEDAVTLAYHVNGGASRSADGSGVEAPTALTATVPAALAAYTADRRPRTTEVVRRSRAAGRPQEWSSPFAVVLRDQGIRLASRLGPGLMLRQLAPVLTWTPPQPNERQAIG